MNRSISEKLIHVALDLPQVGLASTQCPHSILSLLHQSPINVKYTYATSMGSSRFCYYTIIELYGDSTLKI